MSLSPESNGESPNTPLTVTMTAVFWMAVAAALMLAATRVGIGATPDTGHYIRTADNLLAGRGYVRLGPEVMSSWPPLYPTMLAAGKLLGLDALVWARAINLFLLAGCVFIGVRWTYTRTASFAAAATAGAALALGPPLIYVASLALTELLFIALLLLALWQLDTWLERYSSRALVVSTAAVAAACLTRYQGVALAATVGLVILIAGRGTLQRRLLTAIAVGAASVAPLALWIVRNIMLTGNAAGPRFPSEYAFGQAAIDLGRNAMSWFVPWRILLAHPAAGIALFLVLLAASLLLTWRHPPARRLVLICTSFAATFVVLMLLAVTRTSMDPLADRILSPLYPVVILAAIVAATATLRTVSAALGVWIGRLAAAASVAVLILTLLTRTGAQVATSWKEGPGGASHSNFNADEWRASETLLWTREHLDGKLIFASTPAALYLSTGVDSRPMPRKHARRAPGVPMDRLEDIRADVERAGEAYLVISAGHVPSHTFTLEELEAAFTVTQVSKLADGSVFRLTPRS